MIFLQLAPLPTCASPSEVLVTLLYVVIRLTVFTWATIPLDL